MADYVVRMTGQDNLSGTIKQVKSELNDLGKTTSKIDQIDAKFSKITNSTAPLKKQLRDLKTLMAQMNMDGLANTEQYTKIAQEAGKIKDAMDDAAAATKRFSSDTANLDAGVQALQGIVAVGGVATGVMAMFGVENEKVQQAILKVQGALTVLNGVQQVANVLNKDSALIQTLKAAKMRVATAAQVSQTTATKAGTIAQLKLNAAILANPYVLAAAAVVALGAAIYKLVQKYNEVSEAEERAKKITEEVQGVYEDGAKAYIKNKIELNQLKNSLDNFNGSKEEEKRLVDELNNKYGNTLGKYKDLDSWKRALGDSTYYYCNLLKHEAILQAANAKAAEAYIKAISGEDAEVNWSIYNNLLAEAERQQKYVDFFRDQLNKTRRSNGDISYSSSGSGKSTRTTKTGGGGSGSTQQEETGILAQLNNQLKEKQKLLDDENTSLGKQQQLLKEIAELQTRITRIQDARTAATDGTLDKALKSQLTQQKELDKEITASMSNLPTAYDSMQEKQKETEKRNEAIKDSFEGLKSTMSSLGQMAEEPVLNAAGTIAQAIATYILGWSEATAKAADAGPWGWAAFTLATAAQLAAIVAQIHSISGYASGGIISGGSNYGDHILARVNAGEMVLNRKQQSNLFRAIESGNIGAGNTVLVPEFKIKGSDLYGTLRNYSKSVGKTGKITGIR